MAQELHTPHTITLENKETLSVSGVTDVDTFDENKITLFTEDDTLVIEGEDLHIKKLDVANGNLEITGYVYSLAYTGTDATSRGGKGFFRKMLK